MFTLVYTALCLLVGIPIVLRSVWYMFLDDLVIGIVITAIGLYGLTQLGVVA